MILGSYHSGSFSHSLRRLGRHHHRSIGWPFAESITCYNLNRHHEPSAIVIPLCFLDGSLVPSSVTDHDAAGRLSCWQRARHRHWQCQRLGQLRAIDSNPDGNETIGNADTQSGVQKIEVVTVAWTTTALFVAYAMIWVTYSIEACYPPSRFP